MLQQPGHSHHLPCQNAPSNAAPEPASVGHSNKALIPMTVKVKKKTAGTEKKHDFNNPDNSWLSGWLKANI